MRYSAVRYNFAARSPQLMHVALYEGVGDGGCRLADCH